MYETGRFLRSSLVATLLAAIVCLTLGTIAMAAYPADPDNTAPVVTSVIPVDGSTMFTNSAATVIYQPGNATPLVIRADYSDETGGSGVDPATVMVHIDGGNMLFDCPVQTASHVDCNATVGDLPAGNHPIDIYVSDVAGNNTMHRSWVTVVVDSAAPTYANLTPASGSIIHTSQLNSTSINDMSALRVDYDLSDASPSSGYSPMTHINDNFPPGGTMGAMISNTACVKTPAVNPTHYSCQLNRASLLHLGENRLSILLKDKVGNSNYADPSSVNSYTVVDDVAPAITGPTSDPATISATFSDPLPTGALSANLASGIDTASAVVYVDGVMIASGCTASASGISCPTPAGLTPGTHAITVTVADIAGNQASASGTLTIDPPPCIAGKPALSLRSTGASWASYADYTARKLTVSYAVMNGAGQDAWNASITGATATNTVTLLSATPISLGNIASGGSANTALQFNVPAGVARFYTSLTASAEDACGTSYTYPV